MNRKLPPKIKQTIQRQQSIRRVPETNARHRTPYKGSAKLPKR